MPDCDYCSEPFESEDSYLEHLRAEHEGELSRIDQRRVADLPSGSSVSRGPLVLVLILLSLFAIVGYILLVSG